jgi:cytochrome P450
MIDLWIWLKPRGLDTVLGMAIPPKAKQYIKFVEDSVQKRVELEEEIQKQGSAKLDGRKDIFHYILAAKDPETGGPALSREDLVGEANILVVAGSDTTPVVLAGFFFYMTRNSRILAKLTGEIRSTFKSVDEITWGKKLSSFQYLRACIDETLRLCPTSPSDLDREVISDMEIDGCFVRTGTHVGCSPWTISRNEDFYPDANVFRPERFIFDEQAGVTTEDVARAQDSHFPFSLGPFNCVGKNLAMLELTVTIARTLYRMDVRALPGDTLGEGAPELGWGRRHRNLFQYKDAFVAIRNGPMVQFRKRQN